MSQKTRTIRVSMDLYSRLTELGKKNESYTAILQRLFKDNDLIPIVTDDEK